MLKKVTYLILVLTIMLSVVNIIAADKTPCSVSATCSGGGGSAQCNGKGTCSCTKNGNECSYSCEGGASGTLTCPVGQSCSCTIE